MSVVRLRELSIATIARHVLRDAVRNRVLHGAMLLALGLAGAAPIAGRLTAGQDVKVVKDLGLAAINLGGLFIAVFLGVQLVAREIERRTVDTLLSKPIRRHEFVLGQYGGLLATLGLALTALAVVLYVVLAAVAWWHGDTGFAPVAAAAPAADPALLKAVFLIFVQLAVLAAAALCFSTFSSPVVAAVSTCGLYVICHFSAELRNLDDVLDSRGAAILAAGLSYVLPDLAAFDVKAAVVHAQPVTVGYMMLTTASGAAYSLAFLVPGARGSCQTPPGMNALDRSARASGRRAAPLADDRFRWWGRPDALAAAVVLLVALGSTLQVARDLGPGTGVVPRRVSSVPPAQVARRAALSLAPVLADLYWIRAVQLYGRTRLSGGGAHDYARLYPLLDAATTFDPRFDAAYRLGAVYLAEPPPGGPGRPDLAVELLRKGMANAPERWQYPRDIGFVHYWWLRDVEGAAHWFRRAADLPDAPRRLLPLAANTMTEGGDRAGARTLWRLVRDSAGDAWMRDEGVRRLAQLDALDALDFHRLAVDRFRERTGKPPASWRELLAAGDVPAIPVDPTGVAYELSSAGAVTVSRRSALFPLPERRRFSGRPAR